MTTIPKWCQWVWKHAVVHYPPSLITPIVLRPSLTYPHGNKGTAMRRVWLEYRDQYPGIVFIDGDAAIDPWDIRAMNRAVQRRPLDVITGHAWLWPSSLASGQPVPGHRTWRDNDAVWGATHPDGQVDFFTFNCTYIPNRLFARVESLRQWDRLVFPWADTRLSEIAQQSPRIPMWYEASVQVKHLNYT